MSLVLNAAKLYLQDTSKNMKLNIHKILLITSVCVLMLTQTAISQSGQTKGVLEKATNDFKSLKYASAIYNLNRVLKTDPSNVNAQEMIAYSYKMVKNYEGALKWYEKLAEQPTVKPEWTLYLAEALANTEQYERSEGKYRKYLTQVPTDKRAAAFSASNLNLFSKNTGNWKIFYTNLNSLGSDYAPTYYKEGLIFASNRRRDKLSQNVFQWDNTPFSNLYVIPSLKDIKSINADSLIAEAKKQNKQAYRFNDDDTPPTSNDTRTIGQHGPSLTRDTAAVLLKPNTTIALLKGSINTKYHEGPTAVFPDGSIMFTRNNFINGSQQNSRDGINKLKLYTASGSNLSNIKEFPYNNNDYSTGHPAINSDGTVLIFASDMPGGYGGSDLYYSLKSTSGTWSSPVNLGPKINTEGNELFPYLDKQENLIFASTGHAGLGGLDLFEVVLKDLKPVGNPRNLGAPINSSKDDFSLIRSEDGKNGYFSSNRRGNDDIYGFKKASYSIWLEGTITDAKTRLPLVGSRLLMRHLDGTDTLRTNAQGEFRRELPRDMDYETLAQKLSYVSQNGFITTVGITKDSTIKLDIRLNKPETDQQYVLNNCDSLKKVFEVQNIYYDLDRSEIRSDARPALDYLLSLMRKYPKISVNTSSHCDSRASEEYNRQLSIRRGESAKAYLVSKGIAPGRVKVEYYGKTRLVNRCFDGVPCSEADQQLNRRTEFDIILNGINLTRLNCDDK